jgi:hypothetical protein
MKYLGIFNEVFNGKETKLDSILKPGKEPGIAGSYRPISLPPCGRK